ncbi:RhoGEF domain family protein [Acanthocheilonema viteae]
MKRSCSVKNMDLISQCWILFHSSRNNTFRKSLSVDVLDRADCQQLSMVRSPSNFSFKLRKSRSQNFINVVDNADTNLVLTSSSMPAEMERTTVSLSALDKEIETTCCIERRSLSVDDRNRFALRNLDLHEKLDKIPHFCEDLSALMEEPLFDPSLSYLISRQNTSSDHGSACSEVDDSHVDMQYASTDTNTIKDSQNWQSVTNLSELQISPTSEMLYDHDFDLKNLSDELSSSENSKRSNSSMTTGSAVYFTQVMKLPKVNPTDEVDGHMSHQKLEKQLEINEMHLNLESERPSDAENPISSSSSCGKFLVTLSDSARELSVISEHSDAYVENEMRNSDISINEPSLLEKNHRERAVDVDGIISQHRRWHSESRNIVKKTCNQEERVPLKKSVPLRNSPSRNGELSERCKSQMILKEENNFIKNWAKLQVLDGIKNLSSSSPNVNEMAIPSPSHEDNSEQVVQDMQLHPTVQHKEKYKWKEALPAAFGPHQVIGPIQRSSRTVATGSMRKASDSSIQYEKKIRVEKKHSRRTSTLFDFFRKPDLRSFSDVVTPVNDKRSTIAEGFDGTLDTFTKPLLDKIPNTVGTNDGRYLAAHFNKESQKFIPEVNKPEWADLDLWIEEPATWSSTNYSLKLSKKERKKQDIIHELYLTEKHHCQVLVILQQVYQEGLRIKGIMDEAKQSELIPPVLDALLDFHLNFLRQLNQKRLETEVVNSIAKIIYSEFENGERNQAAVYAYTEFCSKYDQCGRLYDEWMLKNAELRKFFDQYEQDSTYKGRTFKMCLLLIAQRLTKYPVLVEKITEMESGAAKEESVRAHQAVKKFAMHVNNEIAKLEVCRRWDRICSQMDHSSKGRFGPNDFFTYDDLILNGNDEKRRVICIGGAVCQNSQKKQTEGTEVVLVLFDDILIMLTNSSSSKYVFLDRGSGSTVIALSKLLVREVPRSTKLFFLLSDDPCPDLFVVSFASKADVDQWKKAIEMSKNMAPKYVKRAIISSAMNLPDEDPEERRFNQEIARWEEKLREIFDKRIKNERELSNYIEKRLVWFEQLRSHIAKVPLMDRTDTTRNTVREKMKGLVKQKFAELRAARRTSLSRVTVVQRAERMYEDDFVSFFDDTYDAGACTSDSNHSTDQSESDEGRQKLPRRNRTFSGIGERRKGGSVRRHTTEPKIADAKICEECDSVTEEEEMRRLPLLLGPVARRAAISIIRENAQLRVENNQLQSEIAFRELRIASLKSRRLATIPASALEALRNKQNELQNEKREFKIFCELHVDEINRRTTELLEKEAELKTREEQLQEQWVKFYEMNNSSSPNHLSHNMMRPINSATSFDRSTSVRSVTSLSKSPSGSSIPLHLAEKTAKVSRSKK